MSWLLVLILLVSVTGASAVAQMHRHAIAAVIVLVAIASGNPANAQVIRTYNNSTDSATNAINDTSAPCNNRFTRTFSVTGSFSVADVNVGILAAHTYRGDLVMYLVSPSGTRIQLTAGSGSNGAANFNAVFDDEASSSISNYTAGDTATPTSDAVRARLPTGRVSHKPLRNR